MFILSLTSVKKELVQREISKTLLKEEEAFLNHYSPCIPKNMCMCFQKYMISFNFWEMRNLYLCYIPPYRKFECKSWQMSEKLSLSCYYSVQLGKELPGGVERPILYIYFTELVMLDVRITTSNWETGYRRVKLGMYFNINFVQMCLSMQPVIKKYYVTKQISTVTNMNPIKIFT